MFDIFKRKKQLKAANSEIEKLKKEVRDKSDMVTGLETQMLAMQMKLNLLYNHNDVAAAIKKHRDELNLKIVELEKEQSVLKEKTNEYSRIIISERDKTRKRNCEFYAQEDNYKKQIAENRFSVKLETFLTYIEILTEGIEEEKINQI